MTNDESTDVNRRVSFIVAGFALALGVIGVYKLHSYAVNDLPWGIVHPMRPDTLAMNAWIRAAELALPTVRHDTTYTFRTDDSTLIEIRVIRPIGVEPAGRVFVIHGIASQKEGGLGAAAWSLQQGFEVVMFDQRGHGRSSGSTCSYGYRESMDLLAIMRSLKPLPQNRPVILWGNSMGAVTAILAADLDGRSTHRIVDLVIEESGYSDVWSLTEDLVKSKTGFHIPFVGRWATERSCEVLGIDPDSITPMNVVSGLKCDLLVLHGAMDERVPLAHGERIAQAMSPSPYQREFVVFSNAGHVGLRDSDPQRYDAAIQRAFGWVRTK
ncbi:MAG TPA: alpha/beta fold hydrolase [Candidatus Didemnitutus sp.]|nr:alpha/beta fold hydrolase [Candidatus Didemnitutus sp.]